MPTSIGLAAAIRGPVILITLGTLIAIDHAGGMRFSRTWPILIIMFGILKLAEFMKGGQQ